jgi:undecaprenyl-diphosphatase
MIEQIVLGIVQGVAEWLPVSSSGLLVLVQTQLFGQAGLAEMIKLALFLHLGTFLAALIYFRKDILNLFRQKESQLRNFLIVSTLVSGGLGFLLLQLIADLESMTKLTGSLITAIVGIFLIITGVLQIKTDGKGKKVFNDLNYLDAGIFGVVQGLAVLPGFSRSGLTIAVLLLRGVDKITALKASFLAGLPIIFAGNILLNINKFSLDNGYLIGMAAAFIFGILTIHGFLKLAKKINFGYFVTAFGVITLISSLV